MGITAFIRAASIAGALVVVIPVQAADEAPHNMSGCLRQGASPGSYELTDLGLADGPKSVSISIASVDLAGHVGHKVEITGTTVKGADTAAHTMSVSALKHLAASCP